MRGAGRPHAAARWVVAAALLGGCGSPAIDPPRAEPTVSPTPASSPSPSSSPSPTPPSLSPAVSARPTGTYLSVDRVSVDICGPCGRLARRAGWDLREDLRAALRPAIRKLPGVSAHIRVTRHRGRNAVATFGMTQRGSGDIRLRLDLRGAPEDVRAQLPLVLAHELHHAQRITKGPGPGRTLLEDLVAEGLADAFALEVHPDAAEVWIHRLDPETLSRLWDRARRESPRPYRKARFRRWFLDGDADPPYAGYALGYAIVERYLARHPDARPSRLALVPADEILADSSFRP